MIFLPEYAIDLEGSIVQGLKMKTQARFLRFKYRLSLSQVRASYLTFLCLSLSISGMGIITAAYLIE